MRSILLAPVRWFMTTKAWEWLSGMVLNHIVLRLWGYPSFPLDPGVIEIWKAIRKWRSEGNHGIIAFTATDRASLTGRLIRTVTGGQFSHAGLLTSYDYPFEAFLAIHMLSKGLMLEHPMNPFAEADEVRVVAIPMTRENTLKALERVASLVAQRDSLRYDFEQRLGNDSRIYCSELVLRVVEGLSEDPNVAPRPIVDRPAFTPDHVASCGVVLYERRLRK